MKIGQLDPSKSQVVHGHAFGEVQHGSETFEVDEAWIDSLKEGFGRLASAGYLPPVLRAHQDDEDKGKHPRPARDGFAYGKVVSVLSSKDPEAEVLRESEIQTPEKEGVWFLTELPQRVVEAQEEGFIEYWSPSFYKDWHPPHPEMSEESIKVAPRHLAFVSIPHQKNLEGSSPYYSFGDLEAVYELNEGFAGEQAEWVELKATEHKEWPVARRDKEWNADDAVQEAQEKFGIDEGEVDNLPQGYVSMFLIYDEEDEEAGNITGGKFPIAEPIDGDMHYVPRAAAAANAALSGARQDPNITQEERQGAEKRLDKIYSLIHDKHADFPESIDASESTQEEFVMDEDTKEEIKELLDPIMDRVDGVQEEVADLKEDIDKVSSEDDTDEDESGDDEPAIVDELKERLEAQKEKVSELREQQVRRTIKDAGVEDEDEIEDLVELHEDNPVEFTNKLVQKAKANNDADLPGEKGVVGSGAEDLSEEEAYEKRAKQIDRKYEDVERGTEEFFEVYEEEVGQKPYFLE